MSTLQHPSSSCYYQVVDSYWDVPRLHRDKIYRNPWKPGTTVESSGTQRLGLPRAPPRPLLDLRSKSGPAIPTLQSSSGPKISPTTPIDMSASRFSLDGRSLSETPQYQPERPGGLTQGLRAKSSRLMRRQNSKTNSRASDWLSEAEDRPERTSVQDLWSRSTGRHNRMRSAGNSIVDKRDISEPFNFKHLTHTHAEHFQEIETADHHILANEFAAIRSTQVPQRELQGIRAECLRSKNTQSEPTSPTRQTPYSPSFTSPVRSTYCERLDYPAAARPPHQVEYFPQSPFMPEPDTAATISGPPRRPAQRAALSAALEFSAYRHQRPLQQQPTPSTNNDFIASTDHAISSSHQSVSESNNAFQDFDFSMVHAVTTPDDSAFPLSPSRIRVSGAELADVPEEDERTTATQSRPSTPISNLRHAKSFPSTRSNSQSWSRSPRKVSGRISGTAEPRVESLIQSEASFPLVGELFDDIPERPRLSMRMSYETPTLDSCWEEDIDYCYEHAAEADCEFDWDRVSIRDGHASNTVTSDDRSVYSRPQSFSESYEDINYATTSPDAPSNELSSLPRLHTSLSVPPLSTANSAKSPSITSLATPATPSYALHSPQPYGSSNRTFLGSTDTLDVSPSLPSYLGSCSTVMSDEIYDNLFHNKSSAEGELPLHALRFDPPASQDISPRSSRSPISKCDSQESFMLSRSSSLRYPQSCDSFGSVPDLVHSNKTSRDKLTLSAEQIAEFAATMKAAETSADVNVASRQKSNQNLAKDLARNSMLQKASSFNGTDEDEHEDNEIVVLPSVPHHERSKSAAVPQPLSAIGARKRSATSATTAPKTGRTSYSLFPPPPLRSPI